MKHWGQPEITSLHSIEIMSKDNSLLFWIKAVVFLDFFGVALVVPLLTSYFRDAGIDTKLLGILSSLYSLSQIFGGIIIGVLSDTQSKHDVLMLSLLGYYALNLILEISFLQKKVALKS